MFCAVVLNILKFFYTVNKFFLEETTKTNLQYEKEIKSNDNI